MIQCTVAVFFKETPIILLSQVNGTDNASQNCGIEYNFSVPKLGERKTGSLNLYTTMNIMLCTPNPKTNELAASYLLLYICLLKAESVILPVKNN